MLIHIGNGLVYFCFGENRRLLLNFVIRSHLIFPSIQGGRSYQSLLKFVSCFITTSKSFTSALNANITRNHHKF